MGAFSPLLAAAASAANGPRKVSSIQQVLELAAAPQADHRTDLVIQGVVTLVRRFQPEPTWIFMSRMPPGATLLRTKRPWPITVGDQVEVSTAVSSSSHDVVVQNVTVLKCWCAGPPKAVTLDEAIKGKGAGELITVFGPVRRGSDAVFIGSGPGLRADFGDRPDALSVLQNLKKEARRWK